MPNFFILGFQGWDFVTDLSNGVIKQSDRAVNCNPTSSWGPNLLDFSFPFLLLLLLFFFFSPRCLVFLETYLHQTWDVCFPGKLSSWS